MSAERAAQFGARNGVPGGWCGSRPSASSARRTSQNDLNKSHVADDESLEVGWFSIDRLPPMGPTSVERIMTAMEPHGPRRLT